MGIALRWIGGPGQFVAGVPAADHEVETEDEAAALTAGGLYERAEDGEQASAATGAEGATAPNQQTSRGSRARGEVSEEQHDG